jgi:hypothetical protein
LEFGNDSQFLAFLNEHMVFDANKDNDKKASEGEIVERPQSQPQSDVSDIYQKLYRTGTAATRMKRYGMHRDQSRQQTAQESSSMRKRSTTIPEPFQFHSISSNRNSTVNMDKSLSKPKSNEPTGPNGRSMLSRRLTHPMSPMLVTKKRFSHATISQRIGKSNEPVFKANPLPRFYQPVPKPSNVSNSSSTSNSNSRMFHAQPIRTNIGTIPIIQKRSLTVPKPFNFASNTAKQHSRSRSKDSIKSVNINSVSLSEHSDSDSKYTVNSENKSTVFKARPMPHLMPFIPKKSTKPLTLLPDDMNLETEARALNRDLFNRKIQEKQVKVDLFKESQEKERLEQEKREIAHFRSTLVHRARPMPDFRPSK